MQTILTGLLIGASMIIAIGPQNAFVLRMGLLRRHVLPLVLFCAISDALLIVAGVAGLGALLATHATIAAGIGITGALFLLWYGTRAFRRALHPVALADEQPNATSLRSSLLMCAAFTWGNPHVYLDTVLLVGALSLPFHNFAKIEYAAGAMAASFVWFFALGYGARLLIPLFKRPLTWRLLDGAIALVMWSIAARLIYGIISE